MAKDNSHVANEGEESLSTRDRILQVALDVFAEKGLHGATVVEIAKRAGVTGGALYRYFDGKEEIFKAVVEQHSMPFAALDMVRGLVPELEPKTALKFIAQGAFFVFFSELDFMRMVLSESMKGPELSRPFFENMLGPAQEFVSECIELWGEKGLLRDDVNPAVATNTFMGMLGYFMVGQALFPSPMMGEIDANELAEQFSTIFLSGVLREGARD